jgi:gluconolactonase
MRSFLFVALLAVGCDSSDSTEAGDLDSATSTDTGGIAETSADTTPAETTATDTTGTDAPSDTPTDAPDLSKVDPLAGANAVAKLKGGFEFTEGTSWNAAGGFLLFSDIPKNTIHKLVPPDTFTEFRNPSGMANGLAWDPSGRLVACEHGTEVGGTVVTLADEFEGADLNSPNDAIVRSDGNVYFTDPDYGLAGRARGVTFKGIYRIDPSGALTVIEKAMNQPNGIALSPDEKTLYVGDSATAITNKWNVAADGSVSGKSKFVDDGSDGMAIDDAGNVYLTGGSDVRVYKPDGTAWGKIPVPETPSNCAFGGTDRKTLYISARTSIYSVALAIPGKP